MFSWTVFSWTGFSSVGRLDGAVGRSDGVPVRQRHALEQLGERRVDGDVRRAGLAEAVRAARLRVDGVEVVAFLRRVLAVRRGHHEVSAVDDLVGLPAVGLDTHRAGLLGVRVAGRRVPVSVPLISHVHGTAPRQLTRANGLTHSITSLHALNVLVALLCAD